MRTGRDVVIGALLGADEFGFSTAPLIAMGCIMMRVCHLNTCPVGIATQDPELRKRFQGTPEQVVNYLMLVAEEVREIMASLGDRRFEDMIGRTELLDIDDGDRALEGAPRRPVDGARDARAARRTRRAAAPARRCRCSTTRSTGSSCAGARRRSSTASRSSSGRSRCATSTGPSAASCRARSRAATAPRGLPEGTIEIAFSGSAGQSFAAWLAPGVTFSLRGETNDYAGKGLSGGVVSVRPPEKRRFRAEENMIVGNTVLYGATAGRAFFRGLAGERFAVRNSGAHAVVEGVGDHGCEYMTGGRVVVLGRTGRNFAAGMSGGIAYVYDVDRRFEGRCNLELVDLEELTDEDEAEVKGADLRARRAHRLAGRAQRARLVGPGRARALRQGDAARLPAGARRAGRSRPARRSRPEPHGRARRIPEDPPGRLRQARPASARARLQPVLRAPARGRAAAARARAAWTAGSRSATRAARWAT